jgi:hypothetical protein
VLGPAAIYSKSLLDRIALLDPIGGKACCQHEHAHVGKAHFVKRLVSRPDIWAAIKRAASAIDNDICCVRQSGQPFFQLREALFRGSRAMEARPRNVPTFEERAKANINNGRSTAAFGVPKLGDEVRSVEYLS